MIEKQNKSKENYTVTVLFFFSLLNFIFSSASSCNLITGKKAFLHGTHTHT